MRINDFVLIIAREALRNLEERVNGELRLRRREGTRTELVYEVVDENDNTCCTITIRPALIRRHGDQGSKELEKIEHWVEVEVNLAHLNLDLENDANKVINILQKAHEIADKIDEYILEKIVLGGGFSRKLEKLKEHFGKINIALSLPIPFIQPLIQIQPSRGDRQITLTQQASKEDIGVLSFKSWLFVKMLISFRRSHFH